MITINKDHKDRVFIDLFGHNKENALSLYNALNHTDYQDVSLLDVMTISDVIYMRMKNDVSFMLDNKILSLWEEQSSYNPNMPLRGLLYFAKQYEGFVARHQYNLYGSRLIKLPTPQFVIFYLGPDKGDEQSELRLSDAFEIPDKGCIEVCATMYNLNGAHNKNLKEKCKVLHDYSFLMNLIRQNKKTMDLETAIIEAVNYCINNDVLAEYLLKHKAEVIGMLLTEYDEVATMNSFRDEGREEGLAEGREEGLAEGREEILNLIMVLSPGDREILFSCSPEERNNVIKMLKDKYEC